MVNCWAYIRIFHYEYIMDLLYLRCNSACMALKHMSANTPSSCQVCLFLGLMWMQTPTTNMYTQRHICLQYACSNLQHGNWISHRQTILDVQILYISFYTISSMLATLKSWSSVFAAVHLMLVLGTVFPTAYAPRGQVDNCTDTGSTRGSALG